MNVPDDRFRWLCELYKPKSEVPAFLEIVDIAGLVRWVTFLACCKSTEPDMLSDMSTGQAPFDLWML